MVVTFGTAKNWSWHPLGVPNEINHRSRTSLPTAESQNENTYFTHFKNVQKSHALKTQTNFKNQIQRALQSALR